MTDPLAPAVPPTAQPAPPPPLPELELELEAPAPGSPLDPLLEPVSPLDPLLPLEVSPLDAPELPELPELLVLLLELEVLPPPGGAQMPAAQVPPVHAMPSVAFGSEQVPVPLSQTPTTWHSSFFAQTTGFAPVQTPA